MEIHYELQGPSETPAIVFSNSLMSNLSMWNPQMAVVAEYRVLRYDSRGHGGSEGPPGAYTFELLAEDVRALMDLLGIERTHFVGLSMGGMVGQALAIHHPERVQSLVLCDTRGHTPEGRKKPRAERIALAEKEGVEPMVERALRGWFSDGFRKAHPEVMDDVRKMIRTTSKEGIIGCSHALNEHNFSPRLSEIRCPTLIVVGEDDPSTPVSEAQEMHGRIAGSKLIVLPRARHLSNMECAEDFNSALTAFLEDVDVS